MARQKFIAGNWKLNLTIAEGTALVAALAKGLAEKPTTAEVAVCPVALALSAVAQAAKGSPIGVGAQNTHWRTRAPSPASCPRC
jgi:triosephosphate isomerase